MNFTFVKNPFMRYLILTCIILLSVETYAQEPIVSPIETFPLNARLIAPLQGTNNRAVIRIERIDPNPYRLEVGDTLLARFYFSLKPVKGEKDLVGLNKGDFFSARMAARQNNLDGSYYYEVFHYKNVSYLKDLKRREALTSDESQK